MEWEGGKVMKLLYEAGRHKKTSLIGEGAKPREGVRNQERDNASEVENETPPSPWNCGTSAECATKGETDVRDQIRRETND
ncbi:uncharacterized protein G2W53_037394 [Senna tora]|uniref:Uncharacterized protein n=1 Tax=Senna tora TaxID=362788 RepID=A0A834W9L4_9FABA|nr:uncharacterized protein G2W53_037394 [Senna tora]